MATDQVLHWIQQDLKLSKPINSFELDFSTGLLFGEILVQYGVCEDLSKFSKKTSKDGKVQNFYQVEAALRELKVPFEGKQINSIMAEERGAALRLLIQLRRALVTTQNEMTETGLKKSLLGQVRQYRQEKTNALAHTIEYETVGGKDMRSNKLKNQDRHLVGFDIQQKLLFEKAKKDADEQDEIILNHHKAQRQQMLTSLKENQTFMKEWEAEGKQNWRKNMGNRADAIAKVKHFEDREVNLFKAKLEKDLNEATHEMQYGVSEFEKNLQKLGIEQNVNIDDAIKRMEDRKGIPIGQIQNFSYAATMNKIKETKKASDFAGKERERRRTKLIVDQATTQARLDSQRQEDLLIQKLLQQQADEAQQSFTDARNRKCKAMQEQDRLAKAEVTAVKSQAAMNKVDTKRRQEFIAAEPQRQAELQAIKEENAILAKNTKLAKRVVNVEIASGLVDLILDLSNEAFDAMRAKENKKLTKQEWRQFSQLFADGKKVSLRNVVKKVQDPADIAIDQNEIAFSAGLSASDIMSMYQNEPALADFYQYLSATGQFNLAAIKPHLWSELQASNNLTLSEDLATANSTQPNLGLAKLIEDVQTRISKKGQKQSQSEPPKVPKDFVLKLCILGRAFAGKKTVAKQIQESFGGKENLKIFNMDDIIVEALDYINPKKQPTQAEIAAMAKQPAKKGVKVEELVPQDIFEGKSTAEYKRLAHFIKTQYFPEAEGELHSKIDLTNQVIDDQVLIDLFVERLKLEYENKPAKKQDIRQGCIRELEIVKQLKDIEMQQEQEAAKPVDPKAKKPASKTISKGPEESLKEELENIRKMDVNGWILVGFPKTLAQTKLLEKALSGFESKYDLPKPPKQRLQDAYSKVAQPTSLIPSEVDPEISQSAFDGMLFMQVGDQEVLRRAKNRKIDPLTNNVYHMEDNPPEETKENLKLIERLQPFENEAGNADRISSVSKRYDVSVEAIGQFAEQFGLVDPVTLECKVPLNMPIKQTGWGEWRKKDAVKEAVFEQVKRIVEFKQTQHQIERQKVFEMLEEEKKLQPVPSQAQTKQVSMANLATPPKGIEGKPYFKTEVSQTAKLQERQDDQKKSVIISISEETIDEFKDGKSTISGPKSAVSHGASMVASSKMLRRVYEINDVEKASRWDQMVNRYYKEGIQCFNMIRLLRQRVFLSLNKTQQNFISFLERPGQLQKKVNDFCDSYNKFVDQFPQLKDNQKTQDELLSRVNILSLQLWETIQQRNQEAVKERAKYMEGGWVYVEMVSLVGYIARMIESEWDRFTMVAALVTGFVVNEELDLQMFVKRLAEKGIEPYSSVSGLSPILNDLVSTVNGTLQTLFNEQHFINVEAKSLEIVVRERDNLFIRINTVLVWGVLALQEIACHSSKVFDVLDDWIVVSVQTENDLCQRAVRELKQAVTNKRVNIDTVLLGSTNLASQINTIAFEEGPPLFMLEFHPNFTLVDKRIDLDILSRTLKVLKSNSSGADLLDYQTFISLVLLMLQRRDLPKQWRFVNFDKLMSWARDHSARPKSDNNDTQILFHGKVDDQRQFVSWRTLFAAMVLVANPSPDSEEFASYIQNLQALTDPETGLITEAKFIEAPSPFDRTEGSFIGKKTTSPVTSEDEEELDHERISNVKRLLFKTFKVTNRPGMRVKDFANALESVFASDIFETIN